MLTYSFSESKIRRGQLAISTPKNSYKIRRIGQDTFIFTEKPNMSEAEFNTPGPMQFNRSKNQQQYQQQSQQQQSSPPQNQGRNNHRQRGYSNHPHPYNNRGRGQHYSRGNRGGRGEGGGGNRYHQDLDNVN